MNKDTLATTSIRDFQNYQKYLSANADTGEARYKYELALLKGEEETVTNGFCYVCDRKVDLLIDFLYSPQLAQGNVRIPNWRERLLCSTCSLNNRTRACIQFLHENLRCSESNSIYISEQVTPLYAALKKSFPGLIGSEYMGERVPYGSLDERGIRNESITRLSFDNDSLDFILSFDVLNMSRNTQGL
jgi:hypothetical protein